MPLLLEHDFWCTVRLGLGQVIKVVESIHSYTKVAEYWRIEYTVVSQHSRRVDGVSFVDLLDRSGLVDGRGQDAIMLLVGQ